MICKDCEKEISSDAKFCKFCGEKIKKELNVASSNRRFLGSVLDYFFIIIFSCVFAFIYGIVQVLWGLKDTDYDWLSFFSLIFYYLVFEGLWGKTIGKLITDTKVVTKSGDRPTFGQIFGRTLTRLVPFEMFSFWGNNPIGWHDRWSKTRVVRTQIYK